MTAEKIKQLPANRPVTKLPMGGLTANMLRLLAIVLMAGVRERLESSHIPACMKGFPITLVSAGLMAVAFMGFSGLFSSLM